jgi:hypothetical protein
MLRFFCVLALLLILQAFQTMGLRAQPTQKLIYPSMVQLIVNPEQFDGKEISIIGFLSMGREGDLLYFHEEDGTHAILQNAIRVQGSKQMHRDAEKLNLKYVKLSGIFHVNDRSKVPFYSGTINDVRSCELWSDPNYPVSQKIHDLLKAH